MSVRLLEEELIFADGRTDEQIDVTNPIVSFLNLAERA